MKSNILPLRFSVSQKDGTRRPATPADFNRPNPAVDELKQMIASLTEQLKPVSKFFSSEPATPKRKLTKAERIAAIIEEQERKLNQDSLQRIKKGGKK